MAVKYNTVGPASIVTFNDAAAGVPVKALAVDIQPLQQGSGDPSPDNIRPISGWTGAAVVVSPTQDAQDSTTYNIAFPSAAGTVYGGTLDVTTGLLTVDRVHTTIDENDNIKIEGDSSSFRFYVRGKSTGALSRGRQICDRLEYVQSGYASTLYYAESGFLAYPNGVLYFKVNETINTVADIKSYLASSGAIEFCYELTTPQTYQLTPTQITTLLGNNNIFADCGDVTVTYRVIDYSPIQSVDGNENIPTPSKYNWTVNDISDADAGRCESGKMHKNRIARKRKLELEWQNVDIATVNAVLTAFAPEYVDVTCLDPLANGYVTKTFYSGDQVASAYNVRINAWTVSFNIIEQ